MPTPTTTHEEFIWNDDEWSKLVKNLFEQKWGCNDREAIESLMLDDRNAIQDTWVITDDDLDAASTKLNRKFRIDFTGECVAACFTLPYYVLAILMNRWANEDIDRDDDDHNDADAPRTTPHTAYDNPDAETRRPRQTDQPRRDADADAEARGHTTATNPPNTYANNAGTEPTANNTTRITAHHAAKTNTRPHGNDIRQTTSNVDADDADPRRSTTNEQDTPHPHPRRGDTTRHDSDQAQTSTTHECHHDTQNQRQQRRDQPQRRRHPSNLKPRRNERRHIRRLRQTKDNKQRRR